VTPGLRVFLVPKPLLYLRESRLSLSSCSWNPAKNLTIYVLTFLARCQAALNAPVVMQVDVTDAEREIPFAISLSTPVPSSLQPHGG
jgi:hypothetical protein